MHCINNEEKEQYIKDYINSETTVPRKPVEDGEIVIMQEHEDVRNAEKMGLTPSKSEKTFEVMLNAIGDSLSELASSHHE